MNNCMFTETPAGTQVKIYFEPNPRVASGYEFMGVLAPDEIGDYEWETPDSEIWIWAESLIETEGGAQRIQAIIGGF